MAATSGPQRGDLKYSLLALFNVFIRLTVAVLVLVVVLSATNCPASAALGPGDAMVPVKVAMPPIFSVVALASATVLANESEEKSLIALARSGKS